MSEERNDCVDADAAGKSRKTATPKRKQKSEHGASGEKRKLFAKYVPPTIEHKKVKPKQADYDTVFAAVSGKGVTGFLYVRGLAGAVLLAVFVYASISVYTYSISGGIASIVQAAAVFLAAFAASTVALVFGERCLQSNLAAIGDGQYAAFLAEEESVRRLLGNPQGSWGAAAKKSAVQSSMAALAGILVGTMIQFPFMSSIISVLLLLGLSSMSSMFGARGRIESDTVRHAFDFAVVAVPLVSVFSVFAQCSENGASIGEVVMQAAVVSILLTVCSAITYRTIEDGNDFDFSHAISTWGWTFGGGVLAAFCGWMSGAGMLLLGLLIATAVLVAVSFYLLHRSGRNIWG